MLVHKEINQRLAGEYRYVATRIQQTDDPAKKLFYFSAFFGEAQRLLNLEWNRDLALIHMVTQQVYTQINSTAQNPASHVLPIDWTTIYQKLTEAASDLAMYIETANKHSNQGQLLEILGRLAEIAYATMGNGSYLFEKGSLKI